MSMSGGMSGLLRTVRKRVPSRLSDHVPSVGFGTTNVDKTAKKVIHATSPDVERPSLTLLNEIVSQIAARDAAETNLVVRALKHRLQGPKPRSILHTLFAADHFLKNLAEGRPATTNFRSVMETQLVPQILLLAKGLAPQGGEEPTPAVRAAALKALQNWAAPAFLNGALSKHRAFAEAYRDASLHTPSPPAPEVADAQKRATTRMSSLNGGNRTRQRSSHQDPLPAAAADPVVAGVLSAPKEDNAFVAYYRKRLELFDTLHVLQKVPLNDKRIKSLRAFIQGNFERFRSLAEQSSGTGHRNDAHFVEYAISKLRAFPDYEPPANVSTAAPAPPPYPPPPSSFTRRPGGGAAVAGPTVDSIPGPGVAGVGAGTATAGQQQQQQQQQQAQPGLGDPQQHQAAAAAAAGPGRTQGKSAAQRRMLMSLAATFAVPGQHGRLGQPQHWAEPHFASLPSDLFGVPHLPQPDPAASAQRIPSFPLPHHAMPPLPAQQPAQQMHYPMQRPQATMYAIPPQQPHAMPYQYAQYPSGGHM